MCLAVVGEGAARGGNHDLIFGVLDVQSAEIISDLIVVSTEAGLEGVANSILFLLACLLNGYHATKIINLAFEQLVRAGELVPALSLTVVGEGIGLGGQRDGTLGNLIALGHGSLVVADAGDGDLDGADVGEVGSLLAVALVDDRVVGALGQCITGSVLDLGDPLKRNAVVGLALGVVDLDSRVRGVGVLGVGAGSDGLLGHLKLAHGRGLHIVIGFLCGAPLDAAVGILRGADLGLRAGCLNRGSLASNKAGNVIGRCGSRQRRTVVNLGGIRSAHLKRSLGNLIALGHGSLVVADAGDGDLDGADVGEVGSLLAVALVDDRVVGALGQCITGSVLDLGDPLKRNAVVGLALGVVDLDSRVRGVGVLGVGAGSDGLLGHRQGAQALGNCVVRLLSRPSPLKLVGIGAGTLVGL